MRDTEYLEDLRGSVDERSVERTDRLTEDSEGTGIVVYTPGLREGIPFSELERHGGPELKKLTFTLIVVTDDICRYTRTRVRACLCVRNKLK